MDYIIHSFRTCLIFLFIFFTSAKEVVRMPPCIRWFVCLSLTNMLKLKAGNTWKAGNLLCTFPLSIGRILLVSRPCDLSCCTGPTFNFQMNVAPDSRSLKERNKQLFWSPHDLLPSFSSLFVSLKIRLGSKCSLFKYICSLFIFHLASPSG